MEAVKILVEALTYPGILLTLTLALGFEAIKRKLEARMQNRIGPKYTGLNGLLQPLWDLLKMLGKEDLTPATANSVVISLSLIWSASLAIMVVYMMPWGYMGLEGFNGDAVMVAAMLTLSLALLYLASISTHSPYPTLGGFRLIGLLASYEAGLAALLAIGYAATGTLSLSEIRQGLWHGIKSKPLLVAAWLLALLVGFILLLAEAEVDPFTLAEAETEIAGGVEAEFAGRKLAFTKLTRDIHVIASILFYTSILLAPQPSKGPLAPLALIFTAFLVSFLVIIVDAASPRLRLIDVSMVAWRILIPLSFAVSSIALLSMGCKPCL